MRENSVEKASFETKTFHQNFHRFKLTQHASVNGFFFSPQLRLDGSVVPTHYDLLLHPDLETKEEDAGFNGTVTIHFNAIKDVNEIVMHSKYLNISSIKFLHPLDLSSVCIAKSQNLGSVKLTIYSP